MVRSALEVTRPARFLQTSCRRRRTTQRRAARFRRRVALGSRPAPNVIQPARPHQAASQSGCAGRRSRPRSKAGIFTTAPPAQPWRSRTGICNQAGGRRLSPSRFTSVARQGGACLPDERLLNGVRADGSTHPSVHIRPQRAWVCGRMDRLIHPSIDPAATRMGVRADESTKR